ncbi:MAG TPA: site-2 protease family protein, partial [Burkholderiaceae bacterium]|nr:site-2 protease family protein [Burkholderiaceae bacterium]
MIVTVLSFLLTLAILIVIHEYGHYRTARACGVKVLRFSVGFGRVLWRRQKSPDDTEFVLSALPLGGYVRMLDEREGPVAPQERYRAFNNKPLWQRSAIVAAGPIANLVLAVVLYACAHWIGIEEPKALLGVPPTGSLAERAGLRAGDLVLSMASPSAQGVAPDWHDVRSMADLRWMLTQSVMRHEPVQLQVADPAGRNRRVVTLDLDRIEAGDIDASLVKRIGL